MFLGKKWLMIIRLSNHVSDGGVKLPGQEMVNEDVDSSGAPQDGGVHQGKRNRTL